MEIAAIGENKNLKYNHVTPVDLDTIPENELEQALIEFAEGSKGLERCLRVMWDNNLKTRACCSGESYKFDIAYIAMEPNVDVFQYLSEDFILNDMVVLEDDEMQVIRLARDKENLFEQLANDILSGKKDNSSVLETKVTKEFAQKWYYNEKIYYMKNNGYSEEDILKEKRWYELNYILDNGNDEEINEIWDEYTKVVREKNKRLLKKVKEVNKKHEKNNIN